MENKEFTVTDDLLASRGQRFLNGIIDLVIVYVILLSIGTTFILIAEITNSIAISNWVDSITTLEAALFGVIILILYYNFTEIYFSRSLAKYFTKTMVVMKDGSKPNGRAIFKRTLTRLIPFEFLSFFGTNSRGWHDTISNTYVVKKHAFNDKKKLFLPL